MKHLRVLIVEDCSLHGDLIARLLIRVGRAAALTDAALVMISPMMCPSSRASLPDAEVFSRPGASLPTELTATPGTQIWRPRSSRDISKLWGPSVGHS
jgi:hypothetical protein